MSDIFKINRRVQVPTKDVKGTIAFVGFPGFASGKWIGVILDEPKGKNNGSVRGQQYFQCEENHGIFLKQNQIIPLDDDGNPIEIPSPISPLDDSTTAGVSGVPKPRSRLSSISTRSKPSTSSRISLASSRQSLAGSRQSLAGSRTQLTTPSERQDRGDGIPIATTTSTTTLIDASTPKRASFVETGFVETLKPQFTPGQSIISPIMATSLVEEKLSNLQYQQEIDNLRAQTRDLTEKLETLRIKRAEDKEKLREFEKTKVHLEQLTEFKKKIMDSQSALKRDLQRAQQEAREAIEAKELHAEEMAELGEVLEMATLDKEMAEEKAETLQIELDNAREKIEEMSVDLELLKTEIQTRGERIGVAGDAHIENSYEFKQMQQQNERLRETLVKMRDFTAQEKHENQKLQKDLDQKKSEIAELARTKKKLSARVEEMEQQVSDLQEQVDAGLGAEEMIEHLCEQKMALEDKVQKLEEEQADLEELVDMNEQIIEGNAELEQELREELDLAHASTREAIREKEAAYETINDREQTINKFRDLVQKLQQQIQDLQHRLENESSKPVSALEVLDFQKMFAETKAHTKAIDLELRKIDTQQATEHVKYLLACMPESFMKRGSDHDAILSLLLLPRFLWKSEILLQQIRDKFPAVEKIDREGLIRGHAIGQFTFRSRLSFFLHVLQCDIHKYCNALNTCQPETLLKVGGTYPEMLAQEKAVDNLIDLLKGDQLDENVPTESLERCINYFNTMFPLLFSDDSQLNHHQMLIDSVKALNSALDSIITDASAIRSFTATTPELDDMVLLAQHTITTSEQIQQQLKLLKRRIPPDSSITNLGFDNTIATTLSTCCGHASKITRTLHETVRAALQNILTSGDPDLSLGSVKLKELAATASDKVYEQDDVGPVQNVKSSLATILENVTKIEQTLFKNEYDINVKNLNKEKPICPIVLRAQAVKQELEETKKLTKELSLREFDIKEQKRLLKEKNEELSEMAIRKDRAENKLGNVTKDYKLTIDTLQRKLDEAQNTLQRKEKEFNDTLDHLQSDYDSLANEKGKLKEKLNLYNKKAQIENSKTPTTDSGTSLTTDSGASLPIVIKDSPFLLQEIKRLKQGLNYERQERRKHEAVSLKKQLDNLTPLPNFSRKTDETLGKLQQQIAGLKKDLLQTLASPKMIDLTQRKGGMKSILDRDCPLNHIMKENQRVEEIVERANLLIGKCVDEAVKRKNGGNIAADFCTFPTNQMAKALKEANGIPVAEIQIPINFTPKEANVKLNVTPRQLHFIQQQLTVN